MKKINIAPKKRTWAQKRDTNLNGKPLVYNVSQQIRYRKAILQLVREMTKETKIKIKKLFESNIAEEFIEFQEKAAALDESVTSKAKKTVNLLLAKFNRLFSIKSISLANTMVDGAKKSSQTSLHSSLKQLTGGLSLKTGVIPKGMEEVAAAIVAENVSLIKSIPSQYFKDITGAVMRSISAGGEGIKELIPNIQKYDGITERRATNIALDQTRKAYNSINRQRMQSIGVKKFKWIHSGGGQHPRRSHQMLDGSIFSFDDLPVINKEQVDAGYEGPIRGIPGDAINCKCVMNPIVTFDDGEQE